MNNVVLRISLELKAADNTKESSHWIRLDFIYYYEVFVPQLALVSVNLVEDMIWPGSVATQREWIVSLGTTWLYLPRYFQNGS